MGRYYAWEIYWDGKKKYNLSIFISISSNKHVYLRISYKYIMHP